MTGGTGIDAGGADSTPRTFQGSGHVEVAVVVVTYNSGGEIADLISSLRDQTRANSLRVVVVDNASCDDTLAQLAEHPDVVVVNAGGNVGYAAGINVGLQHVGDAATVLVLNPDIRVELGAIAALLRRLAADKAIGIVVPLVTDELGQRSETIFNEPGLLRATFDAVLGSVWRSRPALLSEWVRQPSAYTVARPIDWATGAAFLIDRETSDAIGEWDERFFLYSEETDFCRRARTLGKAIWFEPAAVVRHAQGKSGASPRLDALLGVNRIKYMRKHSPRTAGLYRCIALGGALLRARRSESQRLTARFLSDESLWPTLPHGEWTGAVQNGAPVASIVIPAHNESAVISRTLECLASPSSAGVIDVVVACNGCTDDTAARASAFGGVRVIERPEPSKVEALNAGDEAARVWPRIYLDADIDFPASAIPGLLRALASPGILAGRPPFEYETTGATAWVRAYFRARVRVPSLSLSLWGAGVFALSETGHARVGNFPEVIADDVYVDLKFTKSEKAFPLTPPVRVRTPRRASDLIRILTRARRGPAEQGLDTGSSTLRALIATVRGPQSLWDATVYVAFTVVARRRARRRSATWERDRSSRAI